MKFKFAFISLLSIILFLVISCSDTTEIDDTTVTNEYLSLVGTVTHRTATTQELNKLTRPSLKTNCTLDGDTGCSDGASSEFERYVRECTDYPRSWPPSGSVSTFYKSMIYYVDSDSDINLDHYQDELQAHVNQIINSVGSAAYINADIVYFECRDRQNNSCVIQYTVYK